MVKGKFLIMVTLYVILTILVLFNFNLYHRIGVNWGKAISKAAAEELNENTESASIDIAQESHESLSKDTESTDHTSPFSH
jgi:hypothetical protein